MGYRTPTTLLGLPLVDVATGRGVDGDYRRGVARGWIAVGDVAFGVILAVGGIAVGGIALGGVAVGALALAGVALGVWAVGGGALGVFAVGGAAIAWQAASGGLAVARDYADGGAALARHANDAAARAYLESSRFFAWTRAVVDYSGALILLAFLPALAGLWRRLRRRPAP